MILGLLCLLFNMEALFFGGGVHTWKNELTISNQVLGDMEGYFDNKRTVDVRGADKANDTAGDAD